MTPQVPSSLSVTDAVVCHESLQNYVIYTVTAQSLIVRRRFSEFVALRECLVKLFPTKLVPPIPEKQSLTSNIATTTMADDEDPRTHKLMEYRKRMLSVFLNRCLKLNHIASCNFFGHFLDPEMNFTDFLSYKENNTFYKASIYQLAPWDSLSQIENQLYLTLPIPSSADAYLFKELSQEEQFQNFISFETKFLRYELILNNISKANKKLLKHFIDLSANLSVLGSSYVSLSLIQDSNYIETIGKMFERRNIYLLKLTDSINLKFLDKLIELKHFSTTAKELIEYNRKKIIQQKLVEKELFSIKSRYQRYEAEDQRIRNIDDRARRVVGESEYNDISDPPITDEELQTALYTRSKKSLYGTIPGVKKINNMILKYVNDPNPDETRRNKFYNLRLSLFQLERQNDILASEIERINEEVMKELVKFHDWFKEQLSELSLVYDNSLKEFLSSCQGSWKDCHSE